MIFIAGPHKSGSSLLRSLLDGHPALAVIPFETHLAACFGLPIGYRLMRAGNSPAHGADVGKRLESIILGYVAGKEKTADSDLSPYVSSRHVGERAAQLSVDFGPDLQPDHVRSFLRSAYYLAAGSDPGNRVLVEKSVENVELVPSLLSLDPSVRVVQIQRDLEENLASLRRTVALNRRTYPPIRPLAEMLMLTNDLSDRNQRLHPDRVTTIRYEELVGNRESTMKGVSTFLDIEMHPMLLRPTLMGNRWTSNSSVPTAEIGGDMSDLPDPETTEHALERAILQRLTPSDERPSRLRDLLGCLRPAAKERPAAYILNRIAALGGEYV